MVQKDVFISYKAEEFDDANWVKATLERNGISCWLAPASIPGGSSYAVEIPQAIRSCKVFVLMLSEKSQKSKWVPRELDQAINEGKTVMPFMLENCALQDDFNFYLTNVQRYAAYESKSKAIEKMIVEIKAILKSEEPIAAPAAEEKPQPENTSGAKTKPPREKERKPAKRIGKPPKKICGDKKKIALLAFFAGLIVVVLVVCGIVGYRNSRTIRIAGNSFNAKDRSVTLKDAVLSDEDIRAFGKFEELTSIYISGCEITGDNIAPLCPKSLFTLSLTDCGLTDAQLKSIDFSAAEKLINLNVSGNPITSLAVLRDVSDTMNKLNISETGITDISVLNDFKLLDELYADHDGIQDISALNACVKLTVLHLDRNRISDLSPLAKCIKLRELSLNENLLTSLAGLESCIELVEIEAGGNEIESIDGLCNTTVLYSVFLNDNRISDISVLSKSAKTLYRLYVRNNRLREIDALTDTVALAYLNLDNNQITSVSPLENSAELIGVSAVGNQIDSLNGLEGKEKLWYLNLSGNQIRVSDEADIRMVADSASIVNVGENPIASFCFTAPGGFRYLNLHGTELESYERVYACRGNYLFLDYSETIDFNALQESAFLRYYIIGCPLDKQVAVRDVLDYSVEFIDASSVDELTEAYVADSIKGNPDFYH